MSNHDVMEAAVRAMLRERAADISAVPARLASPDHRDVLAGSGHRSSRARGWLLVAASVAAVLSVAGSAVGITQLISRGHSQPAAPTARTTKPTPQSTAPTPGVITRTCTASLPAAWQAALRHGELPVGGVSSFPLASTASGQMLIARDNGHTRDVLLVGTDNASRVIFSVPDPDHHQVAAAAVEANLAMIALDNQPRSAQQWLPVLTDVLLVNLDTGTTRTVVHAATRGDQGGTPSITAAALFDGHVYWDQRSTSGSTITSIKAYDIATGAVHTAAIGHVSWPLATAAGVSWDPHGVNGHGTIQVPAALPAPVASAAPASVRARLVSDGSAYAWIDRSGRIQWWTTGSTRPVSIRIPGSTTPTLSAVAGPYVFFNNDVTSSVLDMRTGALANGQSLNVKSGGLQVISARAGTAYGYTLIDGNNTSRMLAERVDTTTLPDLHC